MNNLSYTEENYLKAIYHLSEDEDFSVSTSSLAESMSTSPASVNDMMKKLAQKKLITYQKYKGAILLPLGKKVALYVIRKHRLWEVFLVTKLGFKWNEVHEVAEQLEHVKSPLLIKYLDKFLGHPTVDPHGDPIPDENGQIKEIKKVSIAEMKVESSGIIVAVNDNQGLLQHLDQLGIHLSQHIFIQGRMEFDESVNIILDKEKNQFLSKAVAENILVTLLD